MASKEPLTCPCGEGTTPRCGFSGGQLWTRKLLGVCEALVESFVLMIFDAMRAALWRIGAARCHGAVSLGVGGFILEPSSLQVRARSYGYPFSSSSWRLALRCSQSPLVLPGAEGKWQWQSLRSLALPFLVRRTSGAVPYSLCSDSPWSSRPQPMRIGGDATCDFELA